MIQPPPNSSIAVTTYFTQSYYTHACLESVREWKGSRHQLVVAAHDESLLLEAYLNACVRDGLIDALLHAPHNNGHTAGVDLCFEKATAPFFFNICNDIMIGPGLVDDCALRLKNSDQLGMIGWHWYTEGTFWRGDRLDYHLRDPQHPEKLLEPRDQENFRKAKWYTGKVEKATGGIKHLCLCNTGFFGMRSDLFRRLGPFTGPYRHYWADDYLNYAVLEQGYDVSHFDPRFRNRNHFAEFQYDNVDVQDRHRNEDRVDIPEKLDGYLEHLSGGLTKPERSLIYWIARGLPSGSVVTNLGVWRGTSVILFLEGMKDGAVLGVDCFDDGKVSAMSSQPPVSQAEAEKYVCPFIKPNQTAIFRKANTLDQPDLIPSDLIFVDAGHQKKCIENDIRLALKWLKPGGTLVFHDYGYRDWPDIKPAVDAVFAGKVKTFHTLAVVKP